MKRLVRILAAGMVAALAGGLFPVFGASMQAPDDDLYTYDLNFRWSLYSWFGPEGGSPEQAVKGEGLSAGGGNVFDAVTAIFGWDEVDQRWLGYFPDAIGIPGANDLEALHFAEVYWIAINNEDGVQWSIVPDGNFIPDPEPGPAATINLLGSNHFDPSHVEVEAGQSVEWVWQGGFHNVISGPPGTEGLPLPEEHPIPVTEGTFTVTFTESGTYPFYCEIHGPSMSGEVVVS